MNKDSHELRDHFYFRDLSDDEWSEIKEHAYKMKNDMERLEGQPISHDQTVSINDQLVSLATDLDILLDDFVEIRDNINEIVDRLEEIIPHRNES
jgi:hypothetical protein